MDSTSLAYFKGRTPDSIISYPNLTRAVCCEVEQAHEETKHASPVSEWSLDKCVSLCVYTLLWHISTLERHLGKPE